MAHAYHFLERFFNPASVAIVGATKNPLKMNFQVLRNLVRLGYKGRIYPVNPGAGEILGIKTFARLQDIPHSIDLVVTAVPAQKTPDIVRDCVETGIENLVIITGGFAEGGAKGRGLQKEMTDLIRKKHIRTLGPNTLSPVNTANNFVISFNPIQKLSRGGISFAFQSGFYEPMINWIFSNLGINKMLDMGNKMDITELDALEYFAQDSDTQIIAMHIESLHGDARKFLSLIKSVSRKKPVIILKVGRTIAGSQAAASHTGAMAGENDAVFDCAIKQAGAVRAQNLEEFYDFAKAFQFLAMPIGNRLSIITLSGGEGVMATDACEMYGLRQANLDDVTRQKLNKIFPPWDISLNPFDAGVCMEFHLSDLLPFFNAMQTIPEDKNVDCTIMQMLPSTFNETSMNSDISKEISDSIKKLYIRWLLSMKSCGKPFALWCTAAGSHEVGMIEEIEANRIPVFCSSERAVKALAAMNQYRQKNFQRTDDR